jgi:hypothetical protein
MGLLSCLCFYLWPLCTNAACLIFRIRPRTSHLFPEAPPDCCP